MIIWDWHHDEYNRIAHFLPDSFRYVGSDVPEFDLLIVPDGEWLQRIPKDKRDKCIIVPCVMDVEHIKSMGYKYAFTKDTEQHDKWGVGSVIVPPIVEDKHIVADKQYNSISLVHDFEKRDPDGFYFAFKSNTKIFGLNSEMKHDVHILPYAQYLLHSKTIGYLCNAVIKAISYRVPVIFSRDAFKRGYNDYLTAGYDCYVVDNPNQAIQIIESTGFEYDQMVENLKQTINKIQSKYENTRISIDNLIDVVQQRRQN